MTQAQLSQVMAQLGSGHLPAIFLVLARVSPLFVARAAVLLEAAAGPCARVCAPSVWRSD